MAGKKKDSQSWAPKMASLVIAWAIIGGIAYFGIIKRMVDLFQQMAPQWQGPTLEAGIMSLKFEKLSAGFPTDLASKALLGGLLVMLVAGILSRARPQLGLANTLAVAASAVCLAASGILFFGAVVNEKNGIEFIVALATIVAVWVLIRLQRFIRRFYSNSPALVSLFFVIFTVTYVIFGQGVNITSIIVSQLDIWLALVASVIGLYASITLARHGGKVRRAA